MNTYESPLIRLFRVSCNSAFLPLSVRANFVVSILEIAKVRSSLFQINGVKKEPLVLPEPDGPVTTLTEKVYVPVKEHPDVSIFFGFSILIIAFFLVFIIYVPLKSL